MSHPFSIQSCRYCVGEPATHYLDKCSCEPRFSSTQNSLVAKYKENILYKNKIPSAFHRNKQKRKLFPCHFPHLSYNLWCWHGHSCPLLHIVKFKVGETRFEICSVIGPQRNLALLLKVQHDIVWIFHS